MEITVTVERELTELFDIPSEEISDCIKKVLSEKQRSHSYIKTVKNGDGFDTIIKPIGWPFILSTKMNITFVNDKLRTEVVVKTKSQWFVLGDAFNAYNGYINKFLKSLRKYS